MVAARLKRSLCSAFFLLSSWASFQYGGQAVIEGVMMRGPRSLALAVRRQDGSVVVEKHGIPAWGRRYSFLKWPLVRGFVALVEALVTGIQMLALSANLAAEEENDKLNRWEITLALLLAVAFTLVFFVILPTAFGHWSASHFGSFGQNILEAALRLALFLAYLIAISALGDIRRVFAYHGAEHKAIHTFEAGAELSPTTASTFSRLHPRCGTSFILLVFVLAVIVYSQIHTPSLIWRIGSRILLLPVLAGLGYELLKWCSRHTESFPVRLIIAPGLWLQKMTTREPDKGQLEVAIEALEAVLAEPAAAGPEPAADRSPMSGIPAT